MIRVPEEEEKEDKTKKLLKELRVGNISNLSRENKSAGSEAEKKQNEIDSRKFRPRHIIIKRKLIKSGQKNGTLPTKGNQ